MRSILGGDGMKLTVNNYVLLERISLHAKTKPLNIHSCDHLPLKAVY